MLFRHIPPGPIPPAPEAPPPPNSIPLKSVSHADLKKAFAEWLASVTEGEVLFRPGEHQPEVYAAALWDRLN